MARVSSTNIVFTPLEGHNNIDSWKKARQEYVRTLGRYLLVCSESDIIQIFDKWEAQIQYQTKIDKNYNFLSALMTISLLHYFNRSYDQIKEHVPFVIKMLQHKSRTINQAASLVFKYLALELPDNIDFLRDLVTNANFVSAWLESQNHKFSALLILQISGSFILPNVFAVTSSKFQLLWSIATGDDTGLRKIAAKVIDWHLCGLPPVAVNDFVTTLFNDCINHFKILQSVNHGTILICKSIVNRYINIIDVPLLINSLLNVVNVKSELVEYSAFNLLLSISKKAIHFFTPDTVHSIFSSLITCCQRFISSTRLFNIIGEFITVFRRISIPSLYIINFLRMVVKTPKYRNQQQNAFRILQTIILLFKDVPITASFFLDAEPSPQYIAALRQKMALFNETKSSLLKYYNEGISPKATQNQVILSLHIIKAFDTHLFNDKDVVFNQIKSYTKSHDEEVRLLVAEVLPLFHNQEALDDLLFLALFDQSKLVRASAVKQLSYPTLLAHCEMLPQVLDDPSYQVKRNGIPIIAQVYEHNPMLVSVHISSFIQHTILSMASASNPCLCARISTLLPLIAEHLLKSFESFVPQVTKICFTFLDRQDNTEQFFQIVKTSESNNNNKSIKLPSLIAKNDMKINDIIHRDLSHDGHALISNEPPFDKSCVNLWRIFHIENQEWIDKRDANLFLTIQKLASYLSPYLNEFMPIFIKILNSPRSDIVFSSALDALITIVLEVPEASQIPTTHPLIVPILMTLLKNLPSLGLQNPNDVAVKIIKLMGTLGVTSFPNSLIEKPAEIDPINEFDFKSPFFYTDFTMNALLKPLNEPHSSLFEVITSIFIQEAECASKFLGAIVDGFSKSLSNSKGFQKDALFNQLEIITYYSGVKMEPYIETLIPYIMSNLNHKSAIEFAFTLSYFLKSEFIPFVQPLFQNLIRIFQKINLNDDILYYEVLLKFLSAAIIFQNQPMDIFVTESEKALSNLNLNTSSSNSNIALTNGNDVDKALLIIDSLITIVQLGDASFECAHITRICIKLLKTSLKTHVFQLLFSLAVYCNLSPDIIEFLSTDENVSNYSIQTLKEYMKNRSLPLENFLSRHSLSVKVSIPEYVPLVPHRANDSNFKGSLFANFPPPQFNNTEKWIEDLSNAVVNESPSIAIRACHKIVQQSPSFRAEIFPIAFLSCWHISNLQDKQKFSAIIQQIFEGENPINPIFLSLAELLVRVGQPFIISNFVIAKACQSPAMALRFLVKHINEQPTDFNAVELMLTLNMRLGRFDSSAGILKTIKLPTAGTWWEKLGDWESALNIYKQNEKQPDTSAILRCYAKLEQWDSVREFAHDFESMTLQEKQENAVWFAWAFYRINDFQKVSYYVKCFPDTDDLNLLLFKIIFFVASNQNDLAKEYIGKSMEMLVRDCSIYSALNASQADENLTYSNYLVELEEALKYKETHEKEILKHWKRRLQYYNGDSYSWMRLVEIRNLAALPLENKKSFLKLISVIGKERRFDLIKERRFDLFKELWEGNYEGLNEPSIQISFHKLQWALEKKREAIRGLHLLNMLYNPNVTKEMFLEEFKQNLQYFKGNLYDTIFFNIKLLHMKTLPDGTREFDSEKVFELGSYLFDNRRVLSNKLRSRICRLEGSFRAQLYQKNESLESLVQTLEIFEKAVQFMPNDYRNWSGLAYAATRAIGDDSKSVFVQKAINGFLKVIQLLNTNNLEYLCQLFSLFFRYGGDVSIPDELVNLGPEIIIQILPQIVCQIKHQNENVRAVVHELLSRFSEKHFQAIVFSLQLLTASKDTEKSKIASDLFHKLGMKHQDLAREAEIFVDGLLRSAVTWYEIWMAKLDAAFLESRRDYAVGMKMLKELFSLLDHPKCVMENQFVHNLESPLKACKNTIKRFTPTEASFNTLWGQLKKLYEIIRDKFKKMETIELETVSEPLANMRNFKLSIPGKYNVNGYFPNIHKIDSTLPILATQKHPRLLYMYDTEGVRWKFLLKGNEDLRLDQRIMQFFNLINSLLLSNKLTSEMNVLISKYAIIPFAPNAGLISWVTGADTMHQLVMEYRKSHMIPLWKENEMIHKFSNQYFDYFSVLQKHEIWDLIAPESPSNELHETFWERAPDAVSYLQCVDTFVLSTALMSMAGYVIGLGDRHLSNIMIQRQTGHVVHIDFGDSFEIAINRDKMPEKVPFRLTRMIVNAFGVTGVEGTFRSACEKIMRVLRDNKSSIIAQLEIFVHEPIFINKDSGIFGEGQAYVLDRIIEKLSGKDPPIEGRDLNTDELKVEEQVDKLIKIASDPYRYVLHYIGWCQFW